MSVTTEKPAAAIAIRPFHIDIPEEELADLRRRLAATRWPDPETVPDQSQGAQLSRLQGLVRYWGTGYDWRRAEAKLNALPQFITEIDGLDIHFIHVRSRHEDALPLIVTHGWPGSVLELVKVIGPLTDPTATAERPRTHSTSSSRRCPATASRHVRRPPAGIPTGSPAPGTS